MARIEIDKITKVDKSILEQDVVRATYSVASTGENERVFQIDTYSEPIPGQITQTLQLNEENLGKFMKLISSEFKSFSIPLLDDKGDVKYGINWGNRANRNVNQAYLDLPIDIYNSDFFPTNGNRFTIRTDDNQDITFTRAQKDNVNGHALQTPEDNSIIGLYLRRRLSVKPGEVITKDVIEAYGRDHITISKIGEFYYLDFASSKTKGTSKTNLKKELSESSFLPYLTAIRTKPFLLLAGISGTGKSRIVRKLAQATNDIDFAADYDGEDRWKKHNPTNFCLIQVKPNWHNSMDVVGFKSNIGGAHYEFTPFIEFIAKAWHYPDTPFFLCLDEMNLAPVEEYFAEFLSAIESRSINESGEYETDPIIKPFREFGEEIAIEMIQHLLGEKMENIDDDRQLSHVGWRFLNEGLSLPKNLIVMGTVNMDETTFSFSRKVLDRAMSIEMNEVNYDAFLTGETEEDVPLLTDCNQLLVERPINAQIVKADIEADKIIVYLKQVNALLEGTPFKLGYRAANEAFLYVSASKMFGSDDFGSALDKFTVMKILSRIEGDDSKLKTKSGKDLLPALLELLTNQFGEDSNSISIQKLTEMNEILVRDHFVSFWG